MKNIEDVSHLDILLIHNRIKGEHLFNKFLYWLIQVGTKSTYNHCQLVLSLNGVYYIAESTLAGFFVTKPLNKWIEEQKTKQRLYKIVSFENKGRQLQIISRFHEILGNKYDAKYWLKLIYRLTNVWLGSKTDTTSTDCFSSIGYIFNLPNYYALTGKDFENY